MMDLYGGQGVGATGTGVGGGMNPMQLLAMLRGSAAQPQMPTNPFQQGGSATPMAQYIGAPVGGGGMGQRPMMAPVAGNPPPQGFPAMGAGGGTQGLMQLLAQLKGGQTGVGPNGMAGGQPTGALPGGAGAGAMAGQTPGALAAQMGSAQPIGAPGSPSMGMTPQGAPAMPQQGQSNPALMDWLHKLMMSQGGAQPSDMVPQG